MKLIKLVVLLTVLLAFISACSGGGGGEDSSTPNSTTNYSEEDLQGTWNVHTLASGPGAPWWERGDLSITSTGSFTSSTTHNYGGENDRTGVLNISSDGEVTLVGVSSLQGQMDYDKTVIVCTTTWSFGSPGTTELQVLVRASNSYSTSDLAGSWSVYGLASGTGAPWWERGEMIIESDGSFTATTIESNGDDDNLSGTLSINSEGDVTLAGVGTLLGNMDAGKTVMVWTDTWSSGSSGTTELKLLTKNGDLYSTSDLEGTWSVHGLASGEGAPWWERGTVFIEADGSFSSITTDSDGGSDNQSGAFILSSNGEVTVSGSTIHGSMDAGKTVIVWTDTWSYGGQETTELKVLVKE